MSRDNRISGNCGGGGIESFARFLINTRTIFRLCGRTTRVSNDNNDRRSERDGERRRESESENSEKFPFANYSENYFVDATAEKRKTWKRMLMEEDISIGGVRWNFNHYSLITDSDDRGYFFE